MVLKKYISLLLILFLTRINAQNIFPKEYKSFLKKECKFNKQAISFVQDSILPYVTNIEQKSSYSYYDNKFYKRLEFESNIARTLVDKYQIYLDSLGYSIFISSNNYCNCQNWEQFTVIRSASNTQMILNYKDYIDKFDITELINLIKLWETNFDFKVFAIGNNYIEFRIVNDNHLDYHALAEQVILVSPRVVNNSNFNFETLISQMKEHKVFILKW
jgi:hypothetical protein